MSPSQWKTMNRHITITTKEFHIVFICALWKTTLFKHDESSTFLRNVDELHGVTSKMIVFFIHRHHNFKSRNNPNERLLTIHFSTEMDLLGSSKTSLQV
jgi:hypothetical protein